MLSFPETIRAVSMQRFCEEGDDVDVIIRVFGLVNTGKVCDRHCR